MWTSNNNAEKFARLALEHTPLEIKNQYLLWGDNVEDEEQKIKKLTKLILHDWSVERAILWLNGDLDEDLDWMLDVHSRRKAIWEKGIQQLDLFFSPVFEQVFLIH
jgi:hypothetical protein